MAYETLKYYNQALSQLTSNMKFITTIFIAVAVLIGSADANSTCYNNCMNQYNACLDTCNGSGSANCYKGCGIAWNKCYSKCG